MNKRPTFQELAEIAAPVGAATTRESSMDRIGRELRLSGFKANAAQFQAGVEHCTPEHVTALMGHGFPVGHTTKAIAERFNLIRKKIYFMKRDDWMRRVGGLALLAYKQALIAEARRYHNAKRGY